MTFIVNNNSNSNNESQEKKMSTQKYDNDKASKLNDASREGEKKQTND